MYDYHVVPFVGRARTAEMSQRTGQEIAGQLQEAIDAGVKDGWEFYRMDSAHLFAAPGCLGGLLGQKGGILTLNMIVFRRPKAG